MRVIKYDIRPRFNWPWRLQGLAVGGIDRISGVNSQFHAFILRFLLDRINLLKHTSDFWVLVNQLTQRVIRCAYYKCVTSRIRFPYVGNERLGRGSVRECDEYGCDGLWFRVKELGLAIEFGRGIKCLFTTSLEIYSHSYHSLRARV